MIEKKTYLLMLMIIAPLVCLEFVDPAVPLLAELTVERLAGFAGGLCLYHAIRDGNAQDRQRNCHSIASRFSEWRDMECRTNEFLELPKQQPSTKWLVLSVTAL